MKMAAVFVLDTLIFKFQNSTHASHSRIPSLFIHVCSSGRVSRPFKDRQTEIVLLITLDDSDSTHSTSHSIPYFNPIQNNSP